MVLTADDVERQQFATTWRGYDRQEVDRFLDLVAASLTQLGRERDQFARRAEEIERESADTLHAERLLKRALVDAQRAADETVAEARRTAQEVVGDARREAAAQRERARAQAAGIRQAVAELHRLRSEYSERVTALLQQVAELPPLPGALDDLAQRAEAASPPREDGDPDPADRPPAAGEADAADDEDEWDGPVPPWA